jgi:DNA polymerase type B, organellar and viral
MVEREPFDFDRPGQFWSWLGKRALRKGVTWVFAHNLGFDFTLLGGWSGIDRGEVSLGFAVLEDPPSILVLRSGRRTFKWVDTLNYWRVSLAQLGLWCGLPKLPLPSRTAPASSWLTYCRRDVDILETVILGLIREVARNDYCSWQVTAAGLAWATYRHSFMGKRPVIHGNYRALALERKACFGGRLECFKTGKVSEEVSAWDVNSLYPSVMASQPMPCSLATYLTEPRREDMHAYLRHYRGVAEVALASGHPPFPRSTASGVRYSRGEGSYWLAGSELERAFDSGAVVGVQRAALYLAEDLFSAFVVQFYRTKCAARIAGKNLEELAAKMMLNSLSGKWAQRGSRWVTDPTLTAPSRWGFWNYYDERRRQMVRCRSLAGCAQYHQTGFEPRHSLPAVYAVITAGGRTELDRCLSVAGKEHVLYADTDALHLLSRGEVHVHTAGLVGESRLGALRETCRGPDAEYWGPKHYRIGDRTVCGALSARAVAVADGVYLQDSFRGVHETIASGVLDRILVDTKTIELAPSSWRAARQYHHT